jgi:hypothetical protein
LAGGPAITIHTTTTPIPPGIESPDEVETRLGTLRFFDGFPDDATVQTLFDNLDFQRAVQAYLLALPALSVAAVRTAMQALGPANSTMGIWEDLIYRAASSSLRTTTPRTATW